MIDPTYPAFPVMAFIGFVLVLIPLPWHLQAWNSGTCLFMIWTALGCLNFFINAIVWRNDAIDRAPIWCDISTALNVALNVAIPCASLCINRRLHNIATCQSPSVTRADKRRQVMIDLAIGVGIPLIQIPLHYIVQGHRYDLIEQIGCWPTTFNTPPAYPLSFLWPIVISLVSMTYGILTLRVFMKRRQQFSQFLSQGGGLNISRYFRLMCLAMIEIFLNTPITAYGLSLNISGGQIQPWISWSNTHFEYNSINTVPALLWRFNHQAVVTMELARWSFVVGPFVFFAFFGFADEARKHYAAGYRFVGKRLGFEMGTKGGSGFASFKKSKPDIPMSQPPHVPRPLVLPHLSTLSSAPSTTSTKFTTYATRDSLTSVAGTSIRKSDYLASPSSPSMCSPPLPVYRPEEETFPPTPTSVASAYTQITASSSSSGTCVPNRDDERHNRNSQISVFESKLGVAL